MSQVTSDDLIRDLRVVADDVEALIKAAAHDASDKVVAARARADRLVQSVKTRLREVEKHVAEQGRSAAKEADAYVREHAWQSIATAAEAGIAVGLFLNARRKDKGEESQSREEVASR